MPILLQIVSRSDNCVYRYYPSPKAFEKDPEHIGFKYLSGLVTMPPGNAIPPTPWGQGLQIMWFFPDN